MFTAQGDRAAALCEYQEVLRLTPDDPEARAAVRDPDRD